MESRSVDYEYRSAWKAGVYEWCTKEGQSYQAVTLTLRKGWVASATELLLGQWLDAWMVANRLTGVLVVEVSRSGALHAHGVLVGERVPAAIEWWKQERGYTVDKVTTDLMGWITYCFKAVTPETVIVWRRSEGKHESVLTPADKPVRIQSAG